MGAREGGGVGAGVTRDDFVPGAKTMLLWLLRFNAVGEGGREGAWREGEGGREGGMQWV